LEPPEFDDALDEDDEPARQGNNSGRVLIGNQSSDEVTAGAGDSILSEELDPFGDDLLVGAVVPDH